MVYLTKTTVHAIYTEKFKDASGKIQRYLLKDYFGKEMYVTAQQLKEAISKKKIIIDNLKLTKDGKLIENDIARSKEKQEAIKQLWEVLVENVDILPEGRVSKETMVPKLLEKITGKKSQIIYRKTGGYGYGENYTVYTCGAFYMHVDVSHTGKENCDVYFKDIHNNLVWLRRYYWGEYSHDEKYFRAHYNFMELIHVLMENAKEELSFKEVYNEIEKTMEGIANKKGYRYRKDFKQRVYTYGGDFKGFDYGIRCCVDITNTNVFGCELDYDNETRSYIINTYIQENGNRECSRHRMKNIRIDNIVEIKRIIINDFKKYTDVRKTSDTYKELDPPTKRLIEILMRQQGL